jgi:chromosome segregation ATPase
MTKSIRITLPDFSSSKAEEIALITKITEAFQDTENHISASYLAGLFTPAFREWVADKILEDAIPDIHEALILSQRDATEWEKQMKEEVTRHSWDVAELRTELKKKEELYQGALHALAEKREDYAQLQSRNVIRNTEVIEYSDKFLAKDKEAEDLKHEIVELKAKLYDLLVK